MLFLQDIQFVTKINEKGDLKNVTREEKKLIYQLFEIYKIKLLSLQDKKFLLRMYINTLAFTTKRKNPTMKEMSLEMLGKNAWRF